MAKGSDRLVLAFFDTEQAADAAAEQLKGWDKANEDIKLGAIGVMTIGDGGKMKTRNYGPRNVGRGAKIGAVLGLIVALTPGVNVIGGLVWGALAGGAVGSLSKKGLGMSDEDLHLIGAELQAGHSALTVLCSEDEVVATTAELGKLGGKTRSFELSEAELQQAQQALEASSVSTASGSTAPATEAPKA
jgi:uncharacterized membrane protein